MPGKKKTKRGGKRPGSGRPGSGNLPQARNPSADLAKKTPEDSDGSFHGFEDITLSQVPDSQSQTLENLADGVKKTMPINRRWRNRRIIAALRKGVPAKEIAKTFGVSLTTIYRIKENKIKRGSCAPAWNNRSKTLNALRAKRKMILLIRKNPLATCRGLSAKVGVSEATGRRILKSLGMKSRARLRRPKLTAENKLRRMSGAQKLINLLKNKSASALIFCSDEAFFDTDPWRNSRTDRIIEKHPGAAGDLGIHEHKQRAPGVMIWGCVTSAGDKQLLVCPPKTKVNAVTFIEMMKMHMEWITRTFVNTDRQKELKGALWIQDSAPSHAAAISQKWMKKELKQFGIKFIAKEIWPPHSPDLNVLDYAIWSKLKKQVKGSTGTANMTELKRRIEQEWAQLTPDYITKMLRRLRSRCERVLLAQGSYYEKRWKY